MRYSHTAAILLAILTIAIVSGCGGSSEEESSAEGVVKSVSTAVEEAAEDASVTVTNVAEQAGDFDAERIEKKIEAWHEGIAERKAELEEIAAKLKGMSPEDLLGDEAKSLKDRSEVLTRHIGDIEEKIEVATGMLANCKKE